MRHAKKAGFVAVIAAAFALGGFILPDPEDQTGPNLFRDVVTLISTRFVDTLDVSDVYERAAEGLVDRLDDPYADLFTPEELEEFEVAYEGHYAGVGMLIEAQAGSAVVQRVFPNTPAERIGVQVGDRVTGIDGDDVSAWSLDRVANALKGEPGTIVEVNFLRRGATDPIRARITRAVVRIPAVPYAVMLEDSIGYVPLLQFNETAGKEMRESVEQLVQQGAHGIVFDLRGNGGGIVDQAVDIAGLFLPKDAEIARQWERGSDDTDYVNHDDPVAPDVPLVVLVDGGSASASEIVAGALQDHDRAVIMGTTSFGKGLVQTAYRVDGGYVLKMTTGKWYTPSGRSIHRERVLQNGRLVEVDDSTHFAAGRDQRPTYHSDAGRTVYGGGGIMPDLEVKADTFSTAEQALIKAIAPKSPDFNVTVFDYASQLKEGVSRDFQVTQAWRDELYRRLSEKGVDIDRPVYDAGSAYVDRALLSLVGRMAFGDAFVKERDVDADVQLLRAMDVIRQGGARQAGLFGYVERLKGTQG